MKASSITTSLLGPITIYSNGDAVTKLKFGLPDSPISEDKISVKAKVQLLEYLEGQRKTFDLALDPSGTDFQNRVWDQLLSIPYGKTISYATQAQDLGDIKCIRAVGTANGKNPIPIIIPCHRVIGKDGSLTGFSSGLSKKELLLRHEGVLKGVQISIFD